MARQLLYVFLLFPFALSAQNYGARIQLEQKRKSLIAEVNKLQDSIQIVEGKLKELKLERQEQDQQTVEVRPEIPQLKVKKNSVLMSRPQNKGQIIVEVKKGVVVQKIDKLGESYLVCINGNCGYLPSSVITSIAKNNKKWFKVAGKV